MAGDTVASQPLRYRLPMAITEDIFERLSNVEDARLCRDIDDDACRETPSSFVLMLASTLLTKVGDAIASPKTTLAWLTTAVGAPAFVLGLLVPLRESGSLIPQLFIGGLIRKLPVRKWVWVIGSLLQAFCIIGIGCVATSLEGRSAGWAILGMIALFSLARGLCSVASKDVLGKTIPKKVRGQLTGWSASAAGLISLGVGLYLLLPSAGTDQRFTISILLVCAGLLWALAALVFAQIKEYAGETGGGRNALASLRKLNLLVTDKPFRRFVLTRALLMCSALSAPFYIALAQATSGAEMTVLGAFVVASGLASLLSAPFWGRFADVSSRRVMIAAALLTSGAGLFTVAAHQFAPELAASTWFLPAAYFVLSIAHSGVRVGRKTYVVDLASGNQRTDYVAISNSVIGVLLLVVGAVGALTPLIGNAGVIGLLALMGCAGALLGSSLPETQNDD